MRLNPVLRGGLAGAFSRPALLRAYACYLAAMAVVLFFWWPRASLASVFQGGPPPHTFTAAAVGLLACLAWLGTRFGAEDFSPGDASLRDMAALTPVPLRVLVTGLLLLAAAHTLFLVALGAPFLAVSLSVSGIPPRSAAAALLLSGSAALAFRTLGILLCTLFTRRAWLRNLLLGLGALLLALLPLLLFPRASPLVAVLALGAGPAPGGARVQWGIAAAADGGLAALFAAGAALALLRARRSGA
jgi:hypothetical protein